MTRYAVVVRPGASFKDMAARLSRFRVRPDPSPFTVTVQSGVVTLQGSPETATLGRGILHEIRHVPGVVAVRDRLSYPPGPGGVLTGGPGARAAVLSRSPG